MPRLVRPRAKVQLQPIGTFQLDEYIHAVMFSPDGSRLAATDASGHVALWDLESRQGVFDNLEHQGAVLAGGVASRRKISRHGWGRRSRASVGRCF